MGEKDTHNASVVGEKGQGHDQDYLERLNGNARGHVAPVKGIQREIERATLVRK